MLPLEVPHLAKEMLSSVGPDACAALVAATFVGLAAARRCYAVDVPVLSHCNGFVSSTLLPRLSTLRQGYRPPLLHPTGLLQSRLADLRPPPAEATPFARETLQLPALSSTPSSTPCCPELVPAGLVSIDWLDQPDATAPICLLIPGLTGSSDSAYIRRTAVALHAAGVRVGCFNPHGSRVKTRRPSSGRAAHLRLGAPSRLRTAALCAPEQSCGRFRPAVQPWSPSEAPPEAACSEGAVSRPLREQ